MDRTINKKNYKPGMFVKLREPSLYPNISTPKKLTRASLFQIEEVVIVITTAYSYGFLLKFKGDHNKYCPSWFGKPFKGNKKTIEVLF